MPQLSSREILSGLIETLISYSFDWGGDFSSSRIDIGDWGQFFDILLTSITSFAERGRYLPLDCFLEICIGIGSSEDGQFRDSAFRDIIGLLDYFSPNSKAIAQMFDWLRTSAKLWTPDDRSVGILNPELHRVLLDRILSKLKDDNPDHILFNGQHDCFVEVSSIPWTFTSGFTLSYWIKIPAVITNKSFELIRCKSPLLSIEVLLLAKSESGLYSVRVVSSSEKRGRDEMRGDLLITSGEWHFLTIKYLGGTNAAANTISFSVDGSVLLESKLTYPVVSQSLETLWTFGNSFQGLIGSITLYSGEVNQNYLHFLHSLGPYISDVGKGASTPQSSYDSGHTPLGTLFTKGPWTKVHKLPRVFCLNPLTVKSNFTLSLSKAGRQFQEFVSMSTSQKQEMEQSLMVGVHGKCTTVQGLSWVDQLFTCGGVTLPLYLLWTYCTKMGRVGLTDDVHLKACLEKLLGMIQHLVATHVDMKEQFIQLHGYHLLSHSLYRCFVDAKVADVVDASLIAGVVDVVVSFGLDSTKGDGVAAALQGLLFDFRFWSLTALPHLKIVLEAAGTVAHSAVDQMYTAIGIQRLLDLVRIHLLKPLTITSRTQEDQKTIAIDCADELLRMLIIMKDSAHAQAQKQKTNISADIDSLLGCLEETNNNLLAERILRLLIQTRHTSPGSLKRSMMNYRFLDTTILAVWMKKGMSLEVRAHAFKLLLWMLSVELHALPSKLYEMRRNVRFVSVVQSSSQSRKLKPVQADLNRIRLGLSQLKEESKGLNKIWRNLWMLAEVVERGLADEIWGASYAVVLPPATIGSEAAASQESGGTNGASPDLQFLITDISMEFQRTAWLYLPFLVPMLSRATVDVAVKTMMLVNVQFKTDEHVLEAIMATEQELWVTMFLKLTWMGTKRFYTSTGDVAMEFETLADISAETFSIVVEYLMRMGIDDDAAFWPTVVDLAMDFTKTVAVTDNGVGSNGGSPVVPNAAAAPTSSFGFLFLRRVVYLVLQRVVKTSEDGWSPGLVQSVNVLLDLIAKHNLHKVPVHVASLLHQDVGSLLEFDQQRHLEWAHLQWSARESEQLLYFLLDLLNALLRVSKRVSLQGGIEWLAMIRVYHLMLDCTADAVSDAVLERLLTEMYQFLGKASETTAPFSEQEFYALVVKTFTTMKENIYRLDYLHPKRAKYEANVFRLLGHFTDLRLRVQEGYDVPVHVRKTMEALRIVGQMADIKMIFDVLEQTFKVNQPSIISFDDYVGTDDLPPASVTGASAAPPTVFDDAAPDTAAAQTLLDLTEAGDGMIPPPDAGFAAFASAALEPTRSSSASAAVAGGSASDGTGGGGGSSPSVASLPPVTDVAPVTVAARYARAFPQWLALRQSIISERIDTERARLTRAMTLQDIATESTKKFWRRLRRKVEAEVFQEAHYCQWKLGIAHEGPFFGRKRLICRPKYDNFYGGLVPSPMHQHQRLDASFVHDVDLSSDELNEALQRQYTGYIKDVTRSEAGEGTGNGNGTGTAADGTTGDDSRHGGDAGGAGAGALAAAGDGSAKRDDDSGGYVDLPGSGWGVVGADGSEEGFGVVGVAQDFSPIIADASDLTGGDTPVVPTSKASGGTSTTTAAAAAAAAASATGAVDEDGRPLRPTANVAGDADELYRAGRTAIETGPCQAAMFKLEHAFKLEAKVVMITASGTCWGVFAIHGDELTFRSSSEQSEARKQDHASVNAAKDTKLRRRRWKIEHIAYIYLRRYRLRDSALEIFFRKGKHRSVFVDFGHTREDAKVRNEFAKAVSQAAPSSAFKQTPSMSAFRMVYEHDNIQEKWLQGKISNFDYLMALNTIAGRSFNDLCQYPVMPWVLNDYTSSTINLHDPSVYRDLSKPMGALNPTRLKEFLDRFHSFEENVSSGIPAFMYGSHYSTMVGVVLHFLVRLQPFAALHQEMQNGHFDVPDRLFSSIPRSFAHNTNQLSEVKELIPEFFTNPDIFRNVNNFNFGETQDGDNIDNVELPPWAKTPEDFVRIHRDALESDYVSEHLHEWIDLIFGYKQRGPDAIEACNVFYYLTYYGSVDHYLITDEAVRKATELQIAHFGQIPMQLFKTPHPARRMHKIRSAPTFVRPLKDCFSATSFASSSSSALAPSVLRLIEPRSDEESIATEAPATLLVRNANSVVIALLVHLDRVTLVLDTGVLDTVKYAASDEVKAMLQAAKEAAKDDAAAMMVTSTTSTAALAAAPALAAGSGGVGGASSSTSASGSNRMGRRAAGDAAASSTGAVAVAAPATVNFPEDFLFPPNGGSNARSTSGDGSTSSGSAVAAASAAPGSRRGRGYSATEDLLGLDSGGQSLDSSTSSATSASLTAYTGGGSGGGAHGGGAWTRPFVTLRDGESIFTIEREVHHFETLPRLPISKKLVQLRWQQRAAATALANSSASSLAAHRSSSNTTTTTTATTSTATDRYEQYYKVKPQVQASESIAEAMASLVVFSRNRLLALTIGDVDGTVHVRELDHKLGAVKSAADFCVHRSRVISASIDQNGREYHLVATLDEQGTVLVWTIFAPKSGAQSSGGSGGPNGGNGGGGGVGANGGGNGSGGSASGVSSASVSSKDSGSGSGANGAAGGAAGAAAGGSGGGAGGGAASGAGGAAGAAGAAGGAGASATTEQEYLARLHSYTIGRRPQRRFYVAPTADMRVDVSWAMGLVTVVTGTRVHLFSIERDELLRVFDVPVTMDNGLDVLSAASSAVAAGGAPTSQPTAATSESGDLLLDVTDAVLTSDDDDYDAANGGGGGCVGGGEQVHQHRECATSGPVACVFARDRFVRSAATATATASSPSRHFLRRLVVSDYGVVVTHVESVTTMESLLEYEDAVVHVHRLVAQTMSGTVTGVVQALSPITCLVCPDRAEVVLAGHRDGSVVVYRAQNLQVLYRWQPDAHCVAVPLVSTSLASAMAASISNATGAATSSMRAGRGSLLPSSASAAGSASSSQGPIAMSQPPLSPSQAVDTSAIVTIAVGPSAAAPAVLLLSTEAGNLYIRALPDFVRWEKNRNPTVLQMASEQLQAVKGTILQAQNWGAETAGVIAQNAMAELKKMRNNSIVKGVFGFFGAQLGGGNGNSDNASDASNSNGGSGASSNSKSAKKK